jgi:hypothetical protein
MVAEFKNTIFVYRVGGRHNIYHLDGELVGSCKKTITNVYLVGSIQHSPGF